MPYRKDPPSVSEIVNRARRRGGGLGPNVGPADTRDAGQRRDDLRRDLENRIKALNDALALPGAGAVTETDGGETTAVIDPRTEREIADQDIRFFDTVHVAQVHNKPDDPRNYGQGPTASTRMCSHRFVLDRISYDLYGSRMGWICVRFHKNGKRGPDWVYGPAPFDVYKAFANSSSKGKFINNVLNDYGYRPASEEFAQYFADFSSNSGTDAAGIKL